VRERIQRNPVLESQRCDDCRITGSCFHCGAGFGSGQEEFGEPTVVEMADTGDVGEPTMLELDDLVEATIQKPFALHAGGNHAAPRGSCRARHAAMTTGAFLFSTAFDHHSCSLHLLG
jgi:hypothetical protein